MSISVHALTRYPVKGLSGQALESVQLNVGQGFPGDRRFGFARPDSGFDPLNPKPLAKTNFYMLALDAPLALLSTHFDEASGLLSISAPDTRETFAITTTEGRNKASRFLKTYLDLPEDETPMLFEASPLYL